jgi:enoyl-CoA hydratase/carnithine racemase
MSSEVHFQHTGRVGLITLDRQKALNALNAPMVEEMTKKLRDWRTSDDVEVVCIEGAGSKAFCAGGDVVSITKDAKDESVPLNFFHDEFQMNHMIGTYPKIYVALIHGITMGGGVGLSVHGKYRVATEKSLYAMPETAIGYFPDVGGTYFLSRLPQPYGMFLGLSGHRLKGADLKHLGIATHYTTVENLPALKADILASDRSSIEDVLQKHEVELPAPFSLDPHDDLIKHCFSADSVPEIISRLQQDGSEFAVKLTKTLLRMSPRSLVLTHRLLSIAPSKSYEECFATEFGAAHQIVRSGEFGEGVRALLVDKDNAPAWNPAKIEDVTEDMVQEYFQKRTRVWEPLNLD